MKLTINYRFLNPRAIWQSLVERHLKRLEKLAAIASAKVTLEREPDAGPAFRVRALLEVPGPDFHAEASDYTIQAAILKVVRNLEHQIKTRRMRHKDKRKSARQADLLSGRPAMSLGGLRA
jgi:ribosomal subunit interface protein